MIRAEKESVSLNRVASRASEEQLRGEWKDLQVLIKVFEQLETLAENYRMREQSKIDGTNAKYLAVKCRTLVLKVR
jgi:hypothetical protein